MNLEIHKLLINFNYIELKVKLNIRKSFSLTFFS